MKTLEEIERILRETKPFLKETYAVKTIGIFGSYATRGHKEGSDLDLLVEFEKPVGFFKFLDLEEYLETIIGIKVELVTRKALKPAIGERILSEVVEI